MKVAIVTGGSNGIGRATARVLGRRGVGVILTYHANRKGAEDVAREIEQASTVRAVALPLDLSKQATFGTFVEHVRVTLEQVWQRRTFDYLVNNGGTAGEMAFTEMSEELFDRLLTTNFKGPFFLTQRLVGLIEDGGRIVNTSSTSRDGSFPGYSAYGASKAALSSWTRYLAKELAARKIRVNAVSPGPTRTNLSDGAFQRHPEIATILSEQIALGRVGEPEDVARVIAGLLSDDFGWVTAQDLEVSGGHLL